MAGALFIATLGAVLLTATSSSRDDAGADEAAQQASANRLADMLVSSPGFWASDNDAIGRLGLGAPNGSGLAQSSIDALKGALVVSTDNGLVDYDDAKDSLGLEPTEDFHVRIYPVGLEAVLATADLSHIDVAYIGDWVSLASISFPAEEVTPLLLLPEAEKSAELAARTNAKHNLTMFSLTLNERTALRDLGVGFDNRVYVSTLAPTVLVDQPFPLPDTPLLAMANLPLLEGDVYPDIKSYLDANLAGRLPLYDLVIVGSGVDQSVLTSAVTKDAIGAWVRDGGTLVVFGSSAQNYQWLQPLFAVGVKTVNGAPTAPDISHPLLREPYELDWSTYQTYGRAWNIKDNGPGAHYDAFNHVIVQDGQDVLAISKDGGFGSGRVALTTFMPRDIGETSPQEARNFLANVILYSDRANLYLDYGAEHPDGQAVAVTVRDSWLWDSKFGQVPVRVQVDVWGM